MLNDSRADQNIESDFPGDPTFSQMNSNYYIPSFKRISADPSMDFHFKKDNHGVGKVYINFMNHTCMLDWLQLIIYPVQ